MANYPLPRFRLYTRSSHYGEVITYLLKGCPQSGNEVDRFEKALCEWMNLPYAACVPRNRVGIYLVISSLIKPGQKVILSPYTIHDIVNMVICAGGIPIFADIERESCNIDPLQVERLIDQDTGAVLVTHLHGLAADMDRLVPLCRSRHVPLVEDCAQAFGTRLHGELVGGLGDAGVFSLGIYKNLNSFLGGVVVTRKEEIFNRVRLQIKNCKEQDLGPLLKMVFKAFITDLVTFPSVFSRLTFPLFRYAFLHDVEFLNRRVRGEDNPQIKKSLPESYLSPLSPLQARIARRDLPRIQGDIQSRIAFAHQYHEGLQDLAGLICPPLREDGSHVYTFYPIQFRERDKLLRFMLERGADVTAQHLKNCADLACFRDYRRDCPVARVTAEEVMLLPTYPRYSADEVNRNIKLIRSYFGK